MTTAAATRVSFSDLPAMNREVEEIVTTAWHRMLVDGQHIGGPEVAEFERSWARYCTTAHAVGTANGTDALQLTLRALGIGPGDEVVVPANTFVATAEAVVLAGATPRFADVNDESLLLTSATLTAAVTPRTKAVIVVHLYGQMADMDDLCRTAEAAGLILIEDAAQAHGATWRGQRAGSFGRAGCFSFYPGKNLGAFGDAGAVVTNDEELARTIRSLGDHGRSIGSHHGHQMAGTNSRLDRIQAAVLTAKLDRLESWTEARREIAATYRSLLADGPIRFVSVAARARHVYHLNVVRVGDRDHVRIALQELGIETGVHYPQPCHFMGPYRRYATDPLPVAERAASEVLSLPLSPHMSLEAVETVVAGLRRVVGENPR